MRPFVFVNEYGNTTIDFFSDQAVKELNKALLFKHYDIEYWDIPEGYLCPPIPGRADYIHHLADLLDAPKGPKVKVLDVGVGANCVYPIIGHKEYAGALLPAKRMKLPTKTHSKLLLKIRNYKSTLTCENKKILIGFFRAS